MVGYEGVGRCGDVNSLLHKLREQLSKLERERIESKLINALWREKKGGRKKERHLLFTRFLISRYQRVRERGRP